MPSIEVRVVNQKGMHARAAAKVVKLAVDFESKILLTHQGVSAPADSLIKLLTLNAPKGSRLTINAEGMDASLALEKFKQLFIDGFGENS